MLMLARHVRWTPRTSNDYAAIAPHLHVRRVHGAALQHVHQAALACKLGRDAQLAGLLGRKHVEHFCDVRVVQAPAGKPHNVEHTTRHTMMYGELQHQLVRVQPRVQ